MDWDKASVELTKKLDPKHVKGRVQGGTQVQYIEGWHAVSEANRIFGFGSWDRETVDLRQLGEPREVNGKIRVDYMARVRITVWGGADGRTVRDGCGFGQGIDRDVGQAHESALKEAETDAMKRALMTFGNSFGLALYDKARENVGVDAPPAPTAEEAKAALMGCKTLDALGKAWADLYRNHRAVADMPEVVAAKDVRKSQLTNPQGEAA
jgi:DNA repair and recombination protein RAD52